MASHTSLPSNSKYCTLSFVVCLLIQSILLMRTHIFPIPSRYMEREIFNKGWRFFFPEMKHYNEVLVDGAIKSALRITDVSFVLQCRPIVSGWMIKKRDQMMNNKKSPFREALKKCEMKPKCPIETLFVDSSTSVFWRTSHYRDYWQSRSTQKRVGWDTRRARGVLWEGWVQTLSSYYRRLPPRSNNQAKQLHWSRKNRRWVLPQDWSAPTSFSIEEEKEHWKIQLGFSRISNLGCWDGNSGYIHWRSVCTGKYSAKHLLRPRAWNQEKIQDDHQRKDAKICDSYSKHITTFRSWKDDHDKMEVLKLWEKHTQIYREPEESAARKRSKHGPPSNVDGLQPVESPYVSSFIQIHFCSWNPILKPFSSLLQNYDAILNLSKWMKEDKDALPPLIAASPNSTSASSSASQGNTGIMRARI